MAVGNEQGGSSGSVGTDGAAGASTSPREHSSRHVQSARVHLAAGQFVDAAAHLAQALALAPDFQPVYAVLEQFAAAVGSPATARAYFQGDGETVSAQHAAASIALLAAEGDYAKALRLLGSVVAVEPDRAWAGAPVRSG